jgi:hypothetical protein
MMMLPTASYLTGAVLCHLCHSIISKIADKLASPAVGGKIFVIDVANDIDRATKEQD